MYLSNEEINECENKCISKQLAMQDPMWSLQRGYIFFRSKKWMGPGLI
jgi:hypothetical protein